MYMYIYIYIHIYTHYIYKCLQASKTTFKVILVPQVIFLDSDDQTPVIGDVLEWGGRWILPQDIYIKRFFDFLSGRALARTAASSAHRRNATKYFAKIRAAFDVVLSYAEGCTPISQNIICGGEPAGLM